MFSMAHEMHIEWEALRVQENNIFSYLSAYHTLFTDSGRTAIHTASQLLSGGEVLVPFFSCLCVVRGFRPDVTLRFYRVRRDFSIDMDDLERNITPKTRAIYFTHYYGSLLSEQTLRRLSELRQQYGLLLIEDTTHSIFTAPLTVGDLALCSIRKWFPLPDGGVLYAKEPLDRIRTDDMLPGGTPEKLYPMTLKAQYLRSFAGTAAPATEPICGALFEQTEADLDANGRAEQKFLLSDLTRFLASCYDVEAAAKARRKNAAALLSSLDTKALIPAYPAYRPDDTLFQVPFYCQNREAFRAYMMERGVFCSVLWRTDQIEELAPFEESRAMGREIISLAIDQRYTPADMERVAAIANAYRD